MRNVFSMSHLNVNFFSCKKDKAEESFHDKLIKIIVYT
jgi:hypothetical protein